MSNIPQARQLIEEVLMTHYVDEDARKLLKKALRLMRRGSAVLLLFALLAPAARADDMPQIPDEATKARALKRAYEINGNSMVGWGRGSIDLSHEDLSVDPAMQARLPPVSELPPKKGRKP